MSGALDHPSGSPPDNARPFRPQAGPAGLEQRGAAPEAEPRTDPAELRAALGRPERDPVARRRLGAEVLIVLGLSLGQAGVYAAISLTAKLTAGRPLAQQTATLNASQSPRPYLDLTYQLVGIVFTLVPVALALWLLSANSQHVVRLLGLDRHRPWRDVVHGLGLAALIGLPGLGLYFVGHALGVTATIVPAALDPHWWTIPVLILQAAKNAVLEEVIVVGYLVSRLQRLGWRAPAVVGASAVLRGSYHLYQGFGPFVGNAVMGVIFAEWYRRGGRVLPLIIAHTVLDVVSFVGYDLFAGALGLK
jgi:membrane protease YdiL (CAAX protease family)